MNNDPNDNFFSFSNKVLYETREFWVGKLVYIPDKGYVPHVSIILGVERYLNRLPTKNGTGIMLKVLNNQNISYFDATWHDSFRNMLVDEQDQVLYDGLLKCQSF